MRHAFPYLHFNAICFLLAASAVLAASIAIWAGTSRRHWFWRVLALWLIAIATIPIRAYELAGILAITLPLLAITIAFLDRLGRRGSGRAEPPSLLALRFPLRDIFLLTLGSALATAAFLHWWRDVAQLGISGGRHWGALLVQFTLAGAAFWTITILAWLTATRYRVLGAVALLVAIPTFAYAIPIVGKTTLFGIRFPYLTPWHALGIYFNPGPLGPAPGILILVFAEFAIGLIATLAITKRLTIQHSPLTFSRRILALPLLFLAVVYLKMLWLTPLPSRFSNAPNNYSRLIEIAQESERLAKPPVAPASPQQQASLIEEAAVLFQPDNYIPYDPIVVAKNPNSLNQLFVGHNDRLRSFAKRIDEEAANALSSGDLSQALDYALLNIRSGLMLLRGAMYFDVMFGNDVHFRAQKRLAGLRHELSPDDGRRVILAIETAINQTEDARAVSARSRAFSERTMGWPERLHHVVEDFGLHGIGLDDATYLHASVRRRESIFRLLQTDLAVRLYHHDHHTWPPSLDQLVPNYLSKLPIDPHSGRPFIYRPASDDFVLYSVGKDRIDNGGNFTSAGAFNRYFSGSTEDPGYDFDLDSLIRP
jgi:hypothetical protein